MCFQPSLFADIIFLKTGKKIEGKIIDRTDKCVKIEVEGINLTYFSEDIEHIEQGANASDPKAAEPVRITIKGSTVIENGRTVIYNSYQLEAARQAAKTANKPIVFLFTEMSPSCPKARQAIKEIVENFQDSCILINIDPQKLSSAPKTVQDVLMSGKGGNMLPVTIITNSTATEVITILPCADSQTYRKLFQEASEAINKYNKKE